MSTSCSAYATDAEAHAAVERLLEDGTPGARISVLTGRLEHDHRDDRPGSFAGNGGAVGAFAGATGSSADAMGAFANGGADERRGGFGDIDRDLITTYRDGVRRVHVASHRELEHVLAGAGLDAGAVAADVASLHHGRVLVLVTGA
jgi:hypothetical protein